MGNGKPSLKERILQTSFDEFFLESTVVDSIGKHFGERSDYQDIDYVVGIHELWHTSAARALVLWAWRLSGVLGMKSEGRTRMLVYGWDGDTLPEWRTPVLERRGYRPDRTDCEHAVPETEFYVMLPDPESRVVLCMNTFAPSPYNFVLQKLKDRYCDVVGTCVLAGRKQRPGMLTLFDFSGNDRKLWQASSRLHHVFESKYGTIKYENIAICNTVAECWNEKRTAFVTGTVPEDYSYNTREALEQIVQEGKNARESITREINK
jgi:hypothetical protein